MLSYVWCSKSRNLHRDSNKLCAALTLRMMAQAHYTASVVPRGCQHSGEGSQQGRTAVSEPIFSKMSLMKEFMMDMALEEIPVSCARQKSA